MCSRCALTVDHRNQLSPRTPTSPPILFVHPHISITTFFCHPFLLPTSPPKHAQQNQSSSLPQILPERLVPLQIKNLKMFSLRAPFRTIRAMPSPIAVTAVAPQLAGRRFYHDKDKFPCSEHQQTPRFIITWTVVASSGSACLAFLFLFLFHSFFFHAPPSFNHALS